MLKKLGAFGLLVILVSSSFVGATLVSDKSPFTDKTDGGGTQDVNVVGSGTGQQDAFINVVKGYINWVLGILALIALIILMYGGFLMVTASGDEEKYKKGFTILRHAAIGLILIGVAWFIISIIFWLTNQVTTTTVGQGSGTDQ